MKKKLFSILLILCFLFSVFALAGCTAQKETSKPDEALSLKGTTIKVFAAYGGQPEIYAAFENATGIKVEAMDMSSGEVLARLRAEKGKSLGDVWFGGGVDSFVAAQNDRLLEAYISPEARDIPSEYKDLEGYWTGVSLVTVNFIVNEERCKELKIQTPQSWQDLLQPQLKGEILMSNPAISGTAYTILAGMLQSMGTEPAWAFLDKLDAQIPFYAKRGGEPPQKAALGEVAVGLAPDTAEGLQAEGYPVVSIFPKDGTPWWPAPVAILKGASNPEGARAFVDWCLSENGQKVLRDNCPRVPTREGIELPETLEAIKEAKLQTIDFVKAGNDRDDVVTEWEKRYSK
jgi:iron(III) transport system substrate-binding protein